MDFLEIIYRKPSNHRAETASFFPKRTTEFFLVHSSLPKQGFFRQVERVADAMGCGQVLDVESGENQTLGADFTEEVLLQRFPKLQVMDG
jgi:hypothetical protein